MAATVDASPTAEAVALAARPAGPAASSRHDQTFPRLVDADVARMARFGTPRRYADGDALFRAGEPGPGLFVLTAGRVVITARDGMGHVAHIAEQGPGEFLAEVGQLSGAAALVDGHAVGAVETVLLPPSGLRALLVAEADLGERIMRALILRRLALIQNAATGPVLIGPAQGADMIRLRGFLARNGQPHHVSDPAQDADAGTWVARYAPLPNALPLVVCIDGAVLRNPSEAELAAALRMGSLRGDAPLYDVAVVGAGPAGLATAVYAASEGLSVVVLDARAYGGQAGASARIENYFGFPTGISGQALTARAFVQAQKFGAEMLIPTRVQALECERDADGAVGLLTQAGGRVRARAVVVASGARYRRPAIDQLEGYEGHGVWYWASPLEARLCAGETVILVGGGNSAGQAAVFLAAHAAKVLMMIRGRGLAATMSRYLIDRISAAPNIELLVDTEIVALEGTPGTALDRVRWANRRSGEQGEGAIRNVFLFVGADPATDWLDGCGVERDGSGFVLTGSAVPGDTPASRSPLESSVPGVYAVGDARSGSVKRVGGAIGEGAQVVAALHGFLAAMQAAV